MVLVDRFIKLFIPFPVMDMVDATNKRKMVNAMGTRGHSGPVLYFMGHLGSARGG